MFTVYLINPNPQDPASIARTPPTMHQSLAAARRIALRRLAGCPPGSAAQIFTNDRPPELKVTVVVEGNGTPLAKLVPKRTKKDVRCAACSSGGSGFP